MSVVVWQGDKRPPALGGPALLRLRARAGAAAAAARLPRVRGREAHAQVGAERAQDAAAEGTHTPTDTSVERTLVYDVVWSRYNKR